MVALVTFTLNRVMAVELALPAVVPGALVAVHYAVQVLRPRLGFGSDVGGRRTPWISAGSPPCRPAGVAGGGRRVADGGASGAGIALAVSAFALVGAGVGAVGTSCWR